LRFERVRKQKQQSLSPLVKTKRRMPMRDQRKRAERWVWEGKKVRPKVVLVEAFRPGLDVRVLLPCS